ncbi:methyltransferase domain-containing protein [Sedimentibacter sp. zth1]|uniref:methyltransferase domain-containing protein n=1 Tax=Sedimentibacter sp. zth1 TaxID=2816908 RepID=UPI001A91D41C|nr:methyltransferase domain-containing protein [Sedimentibacter sp. zth1]QSX05008.1 methyltransferase domain-containing protein [Sedimentibacter sp. zth1]
MVDKKQFGNRINSLRKKLGLSQAQLAEKLNLSTQAVSKWECGLALPDIDILVELSWLFETSINTLLCNDEENSNFSSTTYPKLSESLNNLLNSKEDLKLISSIAPYFSDNELLRISNHISENDLDIKVNINAKSKSKDTSNQINIPITTLSEKTMSELSSAIAESVSNIVGTADIGLNKISEILICPKCKHRLTLHNIENKTYFECDNKHQYFLEDGVLYFNTREIPGEQWSLTYRNYNHYLKEATYPILPVYNRGEIYDEELKWREIKKRKPRIILDIASGTGTGIKYALERIDWNCTVILTDLSHRILAWNRKFITENLYNPFVNVIYLASDCSNLPIKDKAVDCITSNGGFESMQIKTLLGFKESHRILKEKGYAIYDMSLVEDLNSSNTKKWIELYNGIEDNYDEEDNKMIDLNIWRKICEDSGYTNEEEIKVYGEIPAPNTNIFPWENMILRWMCCYVFVSVK